VIQFLVGTLRHGLSLEDSDEKSIGVASCRAGSLRCATISTSHQCMHNLDLSRFCIYITSLTRVPTLSLYPTLASCRAVLLVPVTVNV
jgi:hypothetical protein